MLSELRPQGGEAAEHANSWGRVFQEDGSESTGALVLKEHEQGSKVGTERVRRKVVMGTGLRDEVTEAKTVRSVRS